MANKNSIVEWISNREWIFSVGVTMMLIVVSLLRGKRVEKDTVFMRVGSFISNFIYESLNATMERIDNCSFVLEGIEKEISETENKMEEYRLKAEGVS